MMRLLVLAALFITSTSQAHSRFSSRAEAPSSTRLGLSFLNLEMSGENCRYSTDCRAGEHCLNGRCAQRTPNNRCVYKADCDPVEDCVNGYCRRR